MRIGTIILALGVLLPAGAIFAGSGRIVFVKGDLQAALDAAPPHAIVIADGAGQIEIAATVRISKPLTLIGLKARLKPGLGNTPLLEVAAEGVRIRDFSLQGNAATVPSKDRAPLILVRKGRFVIENGEAVEGSKDGVMITPAAGSGDIEHGVVRNLLLEDTKRDGVSIGGAGDLGLFVRHLVVEDIRAYRSSGRGPVEVSDGAEYITVRDVYAESCAYGVDIQDHKRPGQVNRHILVDNVRVKDTPIAVRMDNSDFGHEGLTIRNVTGSHWPARTRRPLEIRNTSNVLVENVRIYDARGQFSMRIQNCHNVALRNLVFTNSGHDGAALLLENVDGASIDNVVVQGKAQPEVGILYRITAPREFGALRIRDVLADAVRGVGILVESAAPDARLKSCLIAGNTATVRVSAKAGHMAVRDNLPGPAGSRP